MANKNKDTVPEAPEIGVPARFAVRVPDEFEVRIYLMLGGKRR